MNKLNIKLSDLKDYKQKEVLNFLDCSFYKNFADGVLFVLEKNKPATDEKIKGWLNLKWQSK